MTTYTTLAPLLSYRVRFSGRRIGAIGCHHTIVAYVHGFNEADALLRLYDEYEHISFPEFTDLGRK